MRRSTRIRWLSLLLTLWAAEGHAVTAEELALRLAEARQDIKAVEDRLARLEAMLNNQGLLGLLNQVNELKAEVARMRGAQEEQAHALGLAEKRQKELYADLDARIRELANRPVAAPAEAVRLQPSKSLTPAPADAQAESKAYEAALGHFRVGDYPTAVSSFQVFLKDYPDAAMASNAYYWLGLAHASLGDYASAVKAYQKLLKDFPSSNKAPDAMVSLARSQLQLGDAAAAREMLDQVLLKYPQTRAAENARKLLATLK